MLRFQDCCFFFFSSKRRHTRYWRDWSSDVCSSDLEDGVPIYFAGDTCAFGDMQLIRHLYEPQIAVLPIGDHFTMGPAEAALALDMLGSPRCVPCHWGTFPVLTGTPDALEALAEK